MLKDELFVDWILLEGQNHDTPYSHQPESALTEIYDRKKILEVAYRLLSLNRPEYVFNFRGGEPTINPHFLELLSYLYNSHRNIKVILNTNGLRGLNYYNKLINILLPNSMAVNFQVHLDKLNLKELLLLISLFSENKQFCNVIINCLPDNDELSKNICQKLIILRKTIPFSLEIRQPMGGEAPWQAQVMHVFNTVAEPTLKKPEWYEIQANNEKKSGEYCCVGIVAAHVGPDGFISQGLMESDCAFAPEIVKNAVFKGGSPGGAYFDDLDEARKFLDDFAVRSIRYKVTGGAVRHPLRISLDGEQQLLNELKYLQPKGDNEVAVSQNPHLLENRVAYNILPLLGDDLTRLVYLRRLKAQLLGDGAYLVDAMPTLATVNAGNAGLASGLKMDGWVNLENEKEPLFAMEEVMRRAGWFRHDLAIILPQNEVWLDVLYALLTQATEYEFYLGQRKDQTLVYAVRRARIAYLPTASRRRDEAPLLTFILEASCTAEVLSRTLESIMALNLPRYEVLVVVSGVPKAVCDALTKFVALSRWKIRPCLTSGDASAGWDSALGLAQGDYIYVTQCGADVDGAFIVAAVNALENAQAGLALPSPGCTQIRLIEKLEDKIDLLQSSTGLTNVQDKVYRMSLLRNHALSFGSVPQALAWYIFNLRIYLLAEKIVLAPSKRVFIATVGQKEEDGQSFELIGQMAQALRSFCDARGIVLESGLFDKLIYKIFNEYKTTIAHEILGRDCAEYPGFYAKVGWLMAFATRPDIWKEICSDAIAAEAGQRYNAIKDITVMDEADASGQGIPAATRRQADNSNYAVSVILTANSGLKDEALGQLLQADNTLLECVIIDNATEADTERRLRYITDRHPNITLIRLGEKIHPGVCANMGLKLAKGKTVAFLQMDDEIAPDLMDTVILTSARENEDAIAFLLAQLRHEVMPGMKFIESCFEENIDFEETTIFYNREYLLRNHIDFRCGQVEWKSDFTIRALEAASLRVQFAPSISHGESHMQESVYLMGSASCSAAYDILENASRNNDWTREALCGLYAWVKNKCRNFWLPLYTSLDENLADILPSLPPLILQSILNIAANALSSGKSTYGRA